MTPTTESTHKYPHPILTACSPESPPTAAYILQLTAEIYANARSVPCERGGGANGHLFAVMPDDLYLARTGVAFEIPQAPGVQALHPTGTSGPQMNETNRLHDKAHADFLKYEEVSAALQQQLIQAIHKTYIGVLKDPLFNFADVTPKQILAHMVNTYGEMTQLDSETNRKRLSEPFNIDLPIETLFTHVREIQLQAPATDPISDGAAIANTISVLEATGVFDNAISMWNSKSEAEKTMDQFHTFFFAQDKERRRKLTAKTAGFHGANAATAAPTHNITPPPGIAAPVIPDARVGTVNLYYCHTHGLTRNAQHNSATCTFKGPNHKDEATFANTMGGSNTFMQPKANRSRRPNNE